MYVCTLFVRGTAFDVGGLRQKRLCFEVFLHTHVSTLERGLPANARSLNFKTNTVKSHTTGPALEVKYSMSNKHMPSAENRD